LNKKRKITINNIKIQRDNLEINLPESKPNTKDAGLPERASTFSCGNYFESGPGHPFVSMTEDFLIFHDPKFWIPLLK
jgi:hypothetical protein